ncbi:hypothetical protein RUM44_001445 [Polyplax serrata]|uniref:Phosphodiesterase n=1 Tax=Polyplax serrata TaxID=468196 RepID=A0ABR1AK21_POLSC
MGLVSSKETRTMSRGLQTQTGGPDDANQGDSTMKYLNEENVRSFLKSRTDVLEKVIMEEVDPELLERWTIRKTQRTKAQDKANSCRKTSLSRWKFCVHADKRAMLKDLTASLPEAPTEFRILEELSRCIASATNADGTNLYLNTESGLVFHRGTDSESPVNESDEVNKNVAELVARTGQAIRLSADDPLWKNFKQSGTAEDDHQHSLFQAVTRSDRELIGVLHFWRSKDGTPFFEEDEEIVSSYLVWGGVAFHYAQLYISIKKQRRLQEFLLQVVRSIFQDMVSMDTVIVKIIDFAQHLVEADRASLFLIDPEKNELYARLFDFGLSDEEDGERERQPQFRDLRFPADAGIAGYVAKTGKLLNIADAYSDPRFNRSVDQITGYKTKSILCMPIFQAPEVVIGVVQMVNKKTGSFTKEDEKAFEMFAVYCGLALHHARLFQAINNSEQKYKVALEVLSYHSTCTEYEVAEVLPLPQKLNGLDSYDLNFLLMDDMEKAKQTIFMFNDLFGFNKFDLNSIVRFTLTVRKNYRRVPYHNWTHGFGVANSMYTIIKHSPTVFTYNECLALFIGALCHDLDHRGKNNKFMIESASPLANIYTTSTMEHHHFNQTVAILQQDGHNFLQKLNKEEYRQVLNIIKHCILATDLALFFSNKDKLLRIMSDGNFSLTNSSHRSLMLAVAMTGSDLSASAKPWDIQIETVRVIFKEFYQQGDEEKAAGRQPIPMMDRNQPGQQAPSQVEFLTQICIPCYSILAEVVPGAKPLLKGCQENLERWKELCKNGETQDVLKIAKTTESN